jgi:hypothetical protein
MKHRRDIWVTAGMMAALGALVGLRQVGALLTVLGENAHAFSGLPTPRRLDWIGAMAPAQRLLSARDPLLALIAGVLAIALAWRLARLLNPHGTLVAASATGEDRRRPPLQTPLEQPLVRRGFAAAVVTFYLLGGVRPWIDSEPFLAAPYTWGLSGLAFLLPRRPWLGLAAAFLLGGAAIWLLWGEWGVITPRRAPSSGRSGTFVRGLLAGAAAFPVLFPLSIWGRGLLGNILTATGLADPAPWRLALAGMALGLPIAFCCLGLLGHALALGPVARPNGDQTGCPRVPREARVMGGRGALWPAAVPAPLARLSASFLILLAAGEAFFVTAIAVGRYDDGRDLADLVGASRRPSSARALVIFPPVAAADPLPGFLPLMSIQQIDAGGDSPQRTWQYLRRRHYQSLAAGNAFVHLHDCASLQGDSAESLRVDLANLEYNPEPIFARLLLQKLFTCAPSPENLALLRETAEPSRFRSDPGWLRVMGLLYHRFGDHAAAVRFLQQAGLTATEQRKALDPERPLTSGSIAGQISVNGQPGAGLTAGVLPEGPWQTLVGAPHPFELRWVAAAAPTDANGRFHLRNLGEGSYVLILMGDPDHFPVRSRSIHADTHPGRLHLDQAHPARDLGTIRLVTRGATAASPSVIPPPGRPSE